MSKFKLVSVRKASVLFLAIGCLLWHGSTLLASVAPPPGPGPEHTYYWDVSGYWMFSAKEYYCDSDWMGHNTREFIGDINGNINLTNGIFDLYDRKSPVWGYLEPTTYGYLNHYTISGSSYELPDYSFMPLSLFGYKLNPLASSFYDSSITVSQNQMSGTFDFPHYGSRSHNEWEWSAFGIATWTEAPPRPFTPYITLNIEPKAFIPKSAEASLNPNKTTIKYKVLSTLPDTVPVTVEIKSEDDIITTLVNNSSLQTNTEYSIEWNGKDSNNKYADALKSPFTVRVTAIKDGQTLITEDKVATIEIKKLEFYSSDAYETAADWGDVKLVSPDGTADDQLYIGAEIIGDDPEKTDDEIKVKIYRSDIEPPATEPQGTAVTLQEKKRDATGKKAICGIQYPVSSLGIPQGEDGIREYAACDGSLDVNAGDQDGWWFDNRMKAYFPDYVSRGCAHLALSEQDNIDNYLGTEDNAPGHRKFGRPIANNEYVMSGGVEKAVITVKTIDIIGNAWKKPGKTDFMDHILIKNPADIFYFSGHGNHVDGNIGDADNFTAIDIFPDEETLYGDPDNQTIEHSWNSELEWVIFVCCSAGDYNGLSVGKYDNINNKRWRDWRPGLRWAKVLLQDKGIHGILAFHAIAGPGEDETVNFVDKCGSGKTIVQAWQETWVNPPTVICNPAYLNDKISSLQDSDNNDTPIKNWSCMNPGYDAPMYTSSGDEVYDGSGSRIYKAYKDYALDNNPPRFPDVLEVYDGTKYVEKYWDAGHTQAPVVNHPVVCLKWIYRNIQNSAPPNQQENYVSFSIDPDLIDSISNFEIQIFEKQSVQMYPKLTSAPILDEVIDYSIGPGNTEDNIEWEVPNNINLPNNRTYFWRVRAKDNNGNWSSWSPFRWFKLVN